MAEEPKKIQDPPAWWTADQELHRPCGVFRAGPEAIREAARAGRHIFPSPGEQEPVESATSVRAAASSASIGSSDRGISIAPAFEVRLESSDFAPHAWSESIEGIARTPFKAEPQLEGWDDEIQGKEDPSTKRLSGGWVERIDGRDSLHAWGARRFEDSLFEGIIFALVDQDPRKFSSAAARQAAGARPRVLTFDREHLWTFSRRGEDGFEELSRAVIDQPQVTATRDDPNAWGSETRPGYRVLLAPDQGAEPGTEEAKVRSRAYVQKADGDDFEEDLAQRRTIEPVTGELTEIPLVPLYGHRAGFYRGHSPFLRTVWSQAAVANASSDLQFFVRELLQVVGFGAGWEFDDATKQPMGGSGIARTGRWLNSPAPDATATLLQPDPSSLTVTDAWIAAKAEAIRKAHRQIHSAAPRAPVTAREVTLEAVYAGSQLELWVRLHEAAWKKILELFALLAGLPKRGTVSISHDFGLPSDGFQRLHEGYIQSAGVEVPGKVYWAEAKRNNVIDESWQVKDILKMVDEERRRAPAGL